MGRKKKKTNVLNMNQPAKPAAPEPEKQVSIQQAARDYMPQLFKTMVERWEAEDELTVAGMKAAEQIQKLAGIVQEAPAQNKIIEISFIEITQNDDGKIVRLGKIG